MTSPTITAPIGRRATAVVAASLALLGGCTRDTESTVATTIIAATTTTTSTTSTTTTSTTTPTTTSVPETTTTTSTTSTTTTTSTTSTTTTVPPTTTTLVVLPGAGTPIDPGRSAFVGAPAGIPAVTFDGTDCRPLFDAIVLVADQACGPWISAIGPLTWTRGTTDDGVRALQTWYPSGDSWVPGVRLVEPAPGAWAALTVVTENIDADPEQELVVGTRGATPTAHLAIDVLDIKHDVPRVVAHVGDLTAARAVVDPGSGVNIFVAQFLATDELCCPTAYSQYGLGRDDAGWRLYEGPARIAADVTPASQF